jgi:uncharacterized OB-fold protein
MAEPRSDTPPAPELGVGRPTKRRPGSAVGGLPVADSRPTFVDGRVGGSRCTSCGYPSAQTGQPWCPVCQGELAAATFSPAGTVWSSTLVGIPVNTRRPPFVLGYVDLDDGPRVLAHIRAAAALAIDTRVTVVGTELGDLVAEPEVSA